MTRPLRLLSALGLAAALPLATSACDSSGGTAAALEPMPSVAVQDCAGQPVNLLDWTNQYDCAVISVGAGWCQACIKEIPLFNDLFVDYFPDGNVAVSQVLVEDQNGDPSTQAVCQGWESTDPDPPRYDIFHDPAESFIDVVMGGAVGSQLPLQIVVVGGEIVERSFTATPTDLQELCEAYLP